MGYLIIGNLVDRFSPTEMQFGRQSLLIDAYGVNSARAQKHVRVVKFAWSAAYSPAISLIAAEIAAIITTNTMEIRP
jgi:hypothetical protein